MGKNCLILLTEKGWEKSVAVANYMLEGNERDEYTSLHTPDVVVCVCSPDGEFNRERAIRAIRVPREKLGVIGLNSWETSFEDVEDRLRDKIIGLKPSAIQLDVSDGSKMMALAAMWACKAICEELKVEFTPTELDCENCKIRNLVSGGSYPAMWWDDLATLGYIRNPNEHEYKHNPPKGCLNLALREATPEQKAVGIVDLEGDNRVEICSAQIFEEKWTTSYEKRLSCARKMAKIAKRHGASAVLIDGPAYFIPVLEHALKEAEIDVYYKFENGGFVKA